MQKVFKDLFIGQTFDLGDKYPTFPKRCIKISPRKYRDNDKIEYQVGSIYVNVYHTNEEEI